MICRGYDCADALNSSQIIPPWDPMYESFPDHTVTDPDAFCDAMNSNPPPNCGAVPPPSPGITGPGAPWTANGCGTGAGWQSWILDRVGSDFSGNLDAPFHCVSFLSACNAHDRCWASAGPRATCDITFRNSMSSACLGVSDPNGQCQGYASLYHGAVSATTFADATYSEAVAGRQCALWHLDRRENDCD